MACPHCLHVELYIEKVLHVESAGRFSTPGTGDMCQVLGIVTVRTLDLRSRGRGFDSRSGRYQVVSTWMGDSLRTGKLSRHNPTPRSTQPSIPSG